MSYNYDILKMKANEVLDRAIKLYDSERNPFYMTSLICGIGKAKVAAEGQDHNVYVVLDAIYDQYSKHKNLDQLFFEGMELGLTFEDFRALKSVLDILTVQMAREKSGEAPFKVDSAKVLGDARNLISKLEVKQLLDDDISKAWLQSKSEYIENEFGRKI